MAVSPAERRFGDDDAVRPAHSAVRRMAPRLCGSEISSHDEQRLLALFARAVEQALHAHIFAQRREGDHALMRVRAGHGVKLAAVALDDHDARVPCARGDVTECLVRLTLGQIDLVDGGPGAQRLDHRVASLDDAVADGLLHGTLLIKLFHNDPQLGNKFSYFDSIPYPIDRIKRHS